MSVEPRQCIMTMASCVAAVMTLLLLGACSTITSPIGQVHPGEQPMSVPAGQLKVAFVQAECGVVITTEDDGICHYSVGGVLTDVTDGSTIGFDFPKSSRMGMMMVSGWRYVLVLQEATVGPIKEADVHSLTPVADTDQSSGYEQGQAFVGKGVSVLLARWGEADGMEPGSIFSSRDNKEHFSLILIYAARGCKFEITQGGVVLNVTRP